MKRFDMIIQGGGLVGLTAVNVLASKGFSVALIERQKPTLEWDKSRFDFRCSAISRGSERLFQSVNLWKKMVDDRVSPYQRMRVWDALGYGEIMFDAAEVAEPDLGHIIENHVMLKALWQAAEENSNITLYVNSPPIAVETRDENILLILENNTVIQGNLLIGADGGHSWLRESLKIETHRRDYQQAALVATVTTELPHAATAYQRFLPEGPLAFLPLAKPNTSSIVWTTTPEKAQILLALEDAAFCKTLTQHFDAQLGSVLTVMDRKSFKLEGLQAKRTIDDRVVLIGDAAHVIHPLAGQGVNLGLWDVKKLTEILEEARDKQIDIGHPLILRKYERATKGHVTMMKLAMEFFNILFKTDSTAAIGARSMGLNFMNNAKFLKKRIILEAMGI